MLGRKITNPVEKKVLQIIEEYEVMGRVSNRLFSGIRNRETVVNTLTREGFVPDDIIRPKLWAKKGVAMRPRLSITKTAKQKRPDRLNSIRGVLVDKIKKDGLILVKDLDVSKHALTATICQMRKQGHKIETLMESGKAIGYELKAA